MLVSGTEVLGKDLAAVLEPNSTIKVEASEPLTSGAKAEASTSDAQERAAGFQPDAQTRLVVELYAMEEARKHLCNSGYLNFRDTHKTECYDYICELNDHLWYVEVKGTQGQGNWVILTRNEVEHAERYPTIIVVVHDIKVTRKGKCLSARGGVINTYNAEIRPDSLFPLSYQWKVPTDKA